MLESNELILGAVALTAGYLLHKALSHPTVAPPTDPEPAGSEAAGDVRARLLSLREQLEELIKKRYCAPILVRLAWHDSGTFDKDLEGEFPVCGGANGSIRFKGELDHGANAGLLTALNLLKPIKASFPEVSWADVIQMASATAIEVCGGPKIPMRYGRLDVGLPEQCPKEGNLPDAHPKDPAEHLRTIFHRMGFSDQEIVALSGAHALGRAFKDRSGAGSLESTRFTANGPGRKGGQPWTKKWLMFSNDYYQTLADPKADKDLLALPTDKVLFTDDGFKPHAEKYAADRDAFFSDYAKAHAKLSELGARFFPEGGVRL